jgi:ribose 5-phosphate isomerase B
LELKKAIIGLLDELGYDYQDFGTDSIDPVDYPDIAKLVAGAVAAGEFDQGILICSSGIGMSIAANKVKGVRAALCCGTLGADRARRHNDANVLCLGQDAMDVNAALDIVKVYLTTSFEGGRHLRRLDKIRGIEAV